MSSIETCVALVCFSMASFLIAGPQKDGTQDVTRQDILRFTFNLELELVFLLCCENFLFSFCLSIILILMSILMLFRPGLIYSLFDWLESMFAGYDHLIRCEDMMGGVWRSLFCKYSPLLLIAFLAMPTQNGNYIFASMILAITAVGLRGTAREFFGL